MDSQGRNFCKEISLMMFAFGDSHTPNPETVKLVDSILLDQLRSIVQEALKHSVDGKHLKPEELIFLMRHNKYKMRRFVKYLHNRQESKRVKMYFHNLQSPVIDADAEKPKCELLEFIERIDETGELTDLTEIDEVKQARALRADRISQALDESKYLDFCKARCASFHSRGSSHRDLEKLRSWIDPKNEIDFGPEALSVLAYLAYETVAEIVDFVMLIRLDAKCAIDPISYSRGLYYTSVMFNCEQRFTGSNSDYSQVYKGQPAISVGEIKEVMRRICSPQAGRLDFGGKLPKTHFIIGL